jgi:DNA-binding GntR family transcriptional regulator
VRQVLEGHAASLAAQNITAEEIRTLRCIVVEMRTVASRAEHDVDTIQQLTDLNNQFHAGNQRAARNIVLEQITRSIVDVPLVQQAFSRYSVTDTEASAHDHAAILDAVEWGDSATAEILMKKHVHRGLNMLLLDLVTTRE